LKPNSRVVRVIFRRYKKKPHDLIALFPDQIRDKGWGICKARLWVNGCEFATTHYIDYQNIIDQSKPATDTSAYVAKLEQQTGQTFETLTRRKP
jgi:hypothetical protein